MTGKSNILRNKDPCCLQQWLYEGYVAIKQTSLKQGVALGQLL